MALALINRGHQLISDDAVSLSKTAENQLIASCPPSLQDLLAIRHLGILNIRELFGAQAIKTQAVLTLVIKLDQQNNTLTMNPLAETRQSTQILDESLPTFAFPKKAASDLVLYVETAVKLTQASQVTL